jgi:hypothetical protein
VTRGRSRRRSRAALACVCLGLAGTGCASGRASSTHVAAARLDDGALALTQGDFEAAHERLLEARETCGDALLGRQALLLLGALELDPRNPRRSPDQGAEHTARYLSYPETFPWTRPLAESLYLLALELGASKPETTDARGLAAAERAAPDCEVADRYAVQAAAVELPTLNQPSVQTRLRALERKRAELERRLAELQGELERVRMTLRP